MRRGLERIEIPGEHEARERTWAVVQRAFAEREPRTRQVSWRLLALAAAAVAIVAAVASPPGRSLVGSVREAVGVESADDALFALPAGGRLLVTADSGAWVVSADGGKRRIGDYADASWSPFGRFVVGSRGDELAAVTPDGDVEWKLSRPDVRFPRWGGSRTDTRIAYLSRTDLRVVAGDGTNDRVLARSVAPVAPAWRPATFHFLAYAAGGRVVVADAESRRRFWSRRVPPVSLLQWSHDGELLLVQGPRTLRVYDAAGRLRHDLLGRGAAPVATAAFSPDDAVGFTQHARGRSHLWTIPRLRPDGSAARELFSGPGAFAGIAWSPNGRWLLLGWRDANQWLFVRTDGTRRVRAVANVSRQFDAQNAPRVVAWCCS